jgi:hypothetical protein
MARQDNKSAFQWQGSFAASAALLTFCNTCGKEALLTNVRIALIKVEF